MNGKIILLLLVFLAACLIPPVSETYAQPISSRGMTFQPNMIPQLTVTPQSGRNNESFRFSWLDNTFDLEIFFNATLVRKGVETTRLWSLQDFEADFGATVDFPVLRGSTDVTFGWQITDVAGISDHVHNAWLKIEDSSFDYEEITVEEIENAAYYRLPDNLDLSFENLQDKGFIIGNQNKTATELKGFSGKSSWNLDPAVYSSGVITATAWRDLTYWDLYNASNVEGWNAVQSAEDSQFMFGARIVLGDGSNANAAYLIDSGVQVFFNSSAIGYSAAYYHQVKAHSRVVLGTLLDATSRFTENGVQISAEPDVSVSYPKMFYGASNTTVYLYSSSLYLTVQRNEPKLVWNVADVRVWNCQIQSMGIEYSTVDLFNIQSSGLGDNDYGIGTALTVNYCGRIWIYNCEWAVYLGTGSSSTLSNLFVRNCTYAFKCASMAADHYVVDADIDNWNFVWTGSTTELYSQCTFNLNVTTSADVPIENANVTVTYYDQGGGTAFTALTGANGSFAEQTLTMGHYNATGGDTIYSRNPFHLKISKDGYQTYEGNFTLSDKISWNIQLEPVEGGSAGPGTPSQGGSWINLQGIFESISSVGQTLSSGWSTFRDSVLFKPLMVLALLSGVAILIARSRQPQKPRKL